MSEGSGRLEVRGLGKAFGGLDVLRDVTFTVGAGTAVGVVGPNGAGKSTLLRCLVSADLPDAGDVRFDGVVLDETSPAVRTALACVLDDADVFMDLSVIDHLRLFARAHGVVDPDPLVDDVLAELRIETIADRLPSTLSSGQRRRLALASCFVRPRRLLVLDEPEQRLDVDGRQWLIERLTVEKAAGVTVVFASHDEELLAAVADLRVVIGG